MPIQRVRSELCVLSALSLNRQRERHPANNRKPTRDKSLSNTLPVYIYVRRERTATGARLCRTDRYEQLQKHSPLTIFHCFHSWLRYDYTMFNCC